MRMLRSTGFLGFLIAVIATTDCQAQPPPSPEMDASLKRFLQDFVKTSRLQKGDSYFAAMANLSGKTAPEIIVYLQAADFCGSGGCNMLVLAPKGKNSFRIVSTTAVVRPPIRVLDHTMNGAHDLGVWVQGGGIEAGYEAVLSFDGVTYPKNPTVLSAKKSDGALPGETLIVAGVGKPLYD